MNSTLSQIRAFRNEGKGKPRWVPGIDTENWRETRRLWDEFLIERYGAR